MKKTTNDGFLSRAACLQALKEMFSERATLAPGMAGPSGLPYGMFNVADVLVGASALMLTWQDDEQPSATLVGRGTPTREATDAELLTVLRTFQSRVLAYLHNRLEDAFPTLARHPAYSSNLCPEIVPANQVN